MNSMFFYGSLRHEPLLQLVLGQDLSNLHIQDATLADHAIHWAVNEEFPIIVATPGAMCKGALIHGIDDAMMRRVDLYEGASDYQKSVFQVETATGTGSALVYVPTPGKWEPGAPWTLADWQERFGEFATLVAAEMMAGADRYTPADIDRLYPSMAQRAAAKLLARKEPVRKTPSGLGVSDVEVIKTHRPYTEFFALHEFDLHHRRFDGSTSPKLTRAVFMGTDAAILLPYDPVRDCVMVVEQFRPGLMARGDHMPWCLEPIAGRVDAGESPEECARREAVEEAGLSLGALELITSSYPTPGASSEYFYIYVGIADLPEGAAGFGGMVGEAEDIAAHIIPFEKAMEMADSNALAAGPLVLALNWLARHRDRLRANA